MNRRQKAYPATTPDMPVNYVGEEPTRWREYLFVGAAAMLIFMAVVATSTVAVVLYLKYGGGL
jgi:hypothetical protein